MGILVHNRIRILSDNLLHQIQKDLRLIRLQEYILYRWSGVKDVPGLLTAAVQSFFIQHLMSLQHVQETQEHLVTDGFSQQLGIRLTLDVAAIRFSK